jgi:hypothetical protein
LHLIDNIHLVLACLWGITYLLHQVADVVYGVVGGSIQFMYIKRSVFIKAGTGVTGVTGFTLRSQVLAIYGFGQYTGTSSFAYAPGPQNKKA